MDLIRDLLLEQESGVTSKLLERKIKEDREEVIGHIQLLLDANLIEGFVAMGDGSAKSVANINRITWEGYEFLDAARNEENWKAAKKAADSAGALTFETLKALLIASLKDKLGLP